MKLQIPLTCIKLLKANIDASPHEDIHSKSTVWTNSCWINEIHTFPSLSPFANGWYGSSLNWSGIAQGPHPVGLSCIKGGTKVAIFAGNVTSSIWRIVHYIVISLRRALFHNKVMDKLRKDTKIFETFRVVLFGGKMENFGNASDPFLWQKVLDLYDQVIKAKAKKMTNEKGKHVISWYMVIFWK